METTMLRVILGIYRGYIGIMENIMETTLLKVLLGIYMGYIGILEK